MVVWPWATYWVSLSLSFLISEVGIYNGICSQECYDKSKVAVQCEVPVTAPATDEVLLLSKFSLFVVATGIIIIIM